MIDAIITGQSLPALQSALDLAEVGMKVAVLSPARSESVEPAVERDPEGSIADFITRIAEPIEQPDQQRAGSQTSEAAIRRVMPQAPLLNRQGKWLRQSSPEVLGVPAVPLASENIALLGSGGSVRAYLDRITPLLTVGKTRLLGELVRKRMGAKVRDELVDPQAFERFGVLVDELEVAIAAPGLNEALSRSGALSSAVLAYADRHVARETRVSPAQGPAEFRREAIKRLELYGVEILAANLVSVEPQDDGWNVRLSDGGALRSRTLLVDFDRSPVPSSTVRDLLVAVLPAQARVHAIIDMESPVWLDEGATAVALLDGWSLFCESEPGTEQPTGEAMLGTLPEKRCELRVSSGVGDVEELSNVLGTISETKRLPISSEILGLGFRSDDVPVRFAGLAAAPFHTVADRAEAAAALAQHELNFPTLLCVGRALHGDDQGAALGSAHRSTVKLRRRLLGLED